LPIDREGRAIRRFAPTRKPELIEQQIEKLL
jgi:glutathione peroxidase-family protein